MNTTDISLATTLLILGFEIEKIDKPYNSNRAVFSFKESEKLEGTIEDFWNNKLTVNPIRFYNNLKTLKARIYSTRRN